MNEQTTRNNIHEKYWEQVPLKEMNEAQWEALCDGCGKCCLYKLQGPDGEYHALNYGCSLLDCSSGQCSDYENRTTHVPHCVSFTPENLHEAVGWLPDTCAYKRIYQSRPIPRWHPLESGVADSTIKYGDTIVERIIQETPEGKLDVDNIMFFEEIEVHVASKEGLK